jgi:hypothetical protein
MNMRDDQKKLFPFNGELSPFFETDVDQRCICKFFIDNITSSSKSFEKFPQHSPANGMLIPCRRRRFVRFALLFALLLCVYILF